MASKLKKCISGTVSITIALSGNVGHALAASPCFTNDQMTATAIAGTAAGAASVAATDTSTTQILELVAKRREQQNQVCPTGYVSVNGACEPTPTVASAATPPPAVSSASAASVSGAPSPRKPKPVVQAKPSVPLAEQTTPPYPQPISEEKNHGGWVEGFVDYEQREGLKVDGDNNIERTQRTAGVLAGIDRTKRFSQNTGLMMGVLGGFTDIHDKFSTVKTSNPSVPTPYPFFFDDPVGQFHNLSTPGAVFDLSAPHNFTVDTEQDTRGGSVGGYLSYFSRGFFLDGLFKTEFNHLRQSTTSTDTFPHKVLSSDGLGGITRLNTTETLTPNSPATTPPGLKPGPNAALPPGTNVIVDAQGNACFGGHPQDFKPILGDVATDTFDFEQTTGYRLFTLASTVGYRHDLDHGYFFEPTGTITFTYSDYDNDASQLGLANGDTLRLQGGGRVGHSFIDQRQGYVATTAIGAYLYSDVSVNGYVVDGLTSTQVQDEGKLRILGTLDAQIAWLDGVTFYAQGQVRGGEDYWGIGGKLGGRTEW